MGWLAVTDEQRASLAAFNTGSVRVNVVRGTQGGWLVCDDALAEAVPGGPLENFAAWYSWLTPSDDVPALPPPRPPRRQR
jgi:NAD dependent epimerase/dehydratase family enzyme